MRSRRGVEHPCRSVNPSTPRASGPGEERVRRASAHDGSPGLPRVGDTAPATPIPPTASDGVWLPCGWGLDEFAMRPRSGWP